MVQSAVVVTASRPHLIDFAQYWGLRAMLRLSRSMSVERFASIGAFLMRLVGPHLRHNQRALANLAIAFPEKSEAERNRISLAMWSNMGRTFAELLVLDRLVSEAGRITIVDQEKWASRASDGSPLVGCTLHLGNWEIAIYPFAEFGRKPTGVYKPVDNPLIDRWLAKVRSRLYPGGLLSKGDADDGNGGHAAARRLIERARSGSAIGFVCDHIDRRGHPVPFMGRMARFTAVPALIARHVDAQIWLGRCIRLGNESRFQLDIVGLPVVRTGDKRADSLAMTSSIFAVFESWIREHPEQWMWWNTRWTDQASSPPGPEAM